MQLKIVRSKEWINRYIYYFFIVLPFMFPEYFILSGKLHLVNVLLTYFSLALMGLEVVRYEVRRSYLLPFVILALEYIILVFSTYRGHGQLGTTINTSIKKLLLWIVVGKALNTPTKRDSLLHAVRDISVVLFAVNLLTEIIYPKGIPSITVSSDAKYYFLGNVNTIIREIYPGLCCSVLIGLKQDKEITWSTGLFVVGLLYQFAFRYHGATTITAVLLLTAWMVFSDKILDHIKVIYPVVLGVLAYVEVTLVLLSSNASLIGFLSRMFGKSVTFSGRTHIWAKALLEIRKTPILGHGIQSSTVLFQVIGNKFSAHNYFLDLLYQRGALGLCLFLILLILPVFLLNRAKKISKYSYALIGFSCVICSMYLFEPFYSSEAIIIPIILSMILMLKKDTQPQYSIPI